MSERSSVDVMQIGLLVLGGYLLIKYVLPLLQTAAQGASTATNAIAQAGANAYFALNPMAPPIVANTGARGVNVPGVGVVPLSSFSQIAASPDSTYLTGVYAGTDWTISGPLDANGNYTAT